MPAYNPKSEHAEEFICDEEIRETLEYAARNKSNRGLIESILNKAAGMKGLNHREAAVLMDCDLPEMNERIHDLAREIKKAFYGNRIVLFAPLYLSNHCVNGCVYCPYHGKNKSIPRKKLSMEEIAAEVRALENMGHKRLAVECGEHPVYNPIEYVLDAIKTIYATKTEYGSIRRVNVNIAATTVENYRRLHEAGIGTYILFQETYDKKNYEALHPTGPKSDYCYHTEAMDRAQMGGCDDVGCGVLYGLNNYRYELVGQLMHAEHLEARFGVGPHTISVPRLCPADDINLEDFPNVLPDDIFCKIVAIIRISAPYTGMIISTRESRKVREKVLDLGISQISGGSRTSVGGYTTEERHDETAQFDVHDLRTLDQVIDWLLELGYIPSFCTACYRAGRTGDRFMHLVKAGKIHHCCTPNALLTLEEYLIDYAKPDTRALGQKIVDSEMEKLPEPVKDKAKEYLQRIRGGERDFRF